MSDSPDKETTQWRVELEAKREEKDEFFATHPQSPIPPEERDSFDGLAYFDPDLDYRVQATVETHEDPEVVYMETTSGREMRYLNTATLRADIERDGLEETAIELAAYQLEAGTDEPLFIPFRDKTTGQQSYQGGRYMELAADRALEDGEEIIVDFNLAYTPFCAYSDTFDCPLAPEENWLEVAIPAGERYD